jgi:protein SCO1/2
MTTKITKILVPTILLIIALVWVTFGSNLLNSGYGLDRDKMVATPNIESTVADINSVDALKGYVTYLTFGFSHCTNNCPLTLSQFIKIANTLPDDIRLIFVSVDNEKDDLKHLTEFLHKVEPRIIGWKMADKQLKRFAEQFNTHVSINASSEPERGSAIQVIDRNGKWVKTYPYLNLNENALLKDYQALQTIS